MHGLCCLFSEPSHAALVEQIIWVWLRVSGVVHTIMGYLVIGPVVLSNRLKRSGLTCCTASEQWSHINIRHSALLVVRTYLPAPKSKYIQLELFVRIMFDERFCCTLHSHLLWKKQEALLGSWGYYFTDHWPTHVCCIEGSLHERGHCPKQD